MNAHSKPPAGPASLLAALAAWREDSRSFHTDRMLADRVLLATGWQCSPDGARVRWHFGVNPEVSTWEPEHPHPVQSGDAAAGQMPFGWEVIRMTRRNATRDGGGAWHVIANAGGTKLHAEGASLPVALCALAVQAWDLERQVEMVMADAERPVVAARENAA